MINRGIGILMREVMERKNDAPRVEILAFMSDKLTEYRIANQEPDWKALLRESRKIWERHCGK